MIDNYGILQNLFIIYFIYYNLYINYKHDKTY